MSVTQLKRAGFAVESTPATETAHKTVIAVDGPAASGKGTLARQIASRLGYAYLDTGALYRAVALATLEMGGDPANIEQVKPALVMAKRYFTPELLASPALRSYEVSEAASKVAALPEVRIDLLDYQRSFAKNPPGNVGGAVLDGRDIGTVVCPDADIKLFVTASPEVRARRRYDEMKKRHPEVTLERVLSDILQRDQRDTGREMAPAIAADDAYELDTTDMPPVVAAEEAIQVIHSKFLAASL